jgi:hypothetical protein
VNDLDPDVPSPPTDLRSGVHDMPPGFTDGSVLEDLTRAGWATATVDLNGAESKADIIEAVAASLGFPDWVGRNWDALDDALDDLSWWPASSQGRLFVVLGAGQLGRTRTDDVAMLIDVLDLAARRWAETGSPLVVLLET